MAVDWAKLKAEYLTTADTSYRDLAKKYGVNATTIARKAGKEDWVLEKQRQANRTLSRTLSADSNRAVNRAMRLQAVADKLIDKVEAMVDRVDENTTQQSLRQLTGALKDLKEIQMIRSEADIREQEARIKKLEREAEGDDSSDVVIRIEGGDASWSR
jgi:DNA-binding MurR/RpiR family transcriptional regulator